MNRKLVQWIVPLLLMIAALGAYRIAWTRPNEATLLARHREPRTIAPRYDAPQVATDEQLFCVLDRMKPSRGVIDTNVIVHALRLWGPQADFHDAALLSGREMRGYFLDDEQFRRLAGATAAPLFFLGDDGVRARAWAANDKDARTGAAHVDDLLATLAEIDTPLDEPLKTRDGVTSIGALLDDSLQRFHAVQTECEWSAISYARYAFPLNQWRNRLGQVVDLEQLVDRLIDGPWDGVCYGTHRLEALVVLYRADEQVGALSKRTKNRILSHLAQACGLLIRSQSPAGFWTADWSRLPQATNDQAGPLAQRILATGHHLEWLALAPAEVQPPREVVIRAGQWLTHAFQDVDEATLRLEFGPFSHAARALCLWRSQDPFDAWRRGATSPATAP